MTSLALIRHELFEEYILSDFTNPAKRVLSCVEKAAKATEKESTAEVWAEILGLDKKTSKTDPHKVIAKLGLLRDQLDLVQYSMSSTDFSSNLYKPHLDKIRKTVTVGNIGAGWSNYKPQLSPDTMLSLMFCAEIIKDESGVSFDELQNLLSKITELKNEIESGSITGPTYEFILSQLNIIEGAIRDYPIVGGNAIKRAFKDGFSDLTERAEYLTGNEEAEATGKLGKIWQDLKSAGGEFVEADRIANGFVGLIEKGQTLSELVQKLPFFGS